MNWSIGISILALVVSAGTLGLRWQEIWWAKKRQRAELFLTFQRWLLEPEMQQGRTLLYGALRTPEQWRSLEWSGVRTFEGPPPPADNEGRRVGRVLAVFDTLAWHAEENLVDPKVVEAEWGHFLRRAAPNIWTYIESREDNTERAVWRHLQALLPSAPPTTRS